MNINHIKDNNVIVKTTNISQIKIPMIQRDYVQGLETNNNKLDRFLDALYNIINSNNINDTLSLDFIYGNINDDGIFEPIDGQQRLTTLALLNFYFFCKQENNIYEDDKQNNTYLQNTFDYITYTTRQSAEKFCKILSNKDFIKHFKSNISNKQPSSIINEYNKYFKEYNDDTTIIAMIKALDKIHDKFKNIETYKYKNINKITFKILPMNNFKLSDDLYIKMNGRGKQLSSFENFKAEYFKWLKENNIKNNEEIKRKFNNEYIDIFWDFAFENIKNTEKLPDPESLFFRFINRFVVGKYLLLTDKEKDEYKIKNEFDDIFFDKDGIVSERDEVKFAGINMYINIFNHDNDTSIKNHAKFINILDNLYDLKTLYKGNFKNIVLDIYSSSWDNEKLNFFSDTKHLGYKEVLIFNSISSYLEQKDIISKNEIKQYNTAEILKKISRIVWNITEQYHLLTGISKNTYKTVYTRVDFSNIKSINIYNEYEEIAKNTIKNKDLENDDNITTIIDDEINKCKYIIHQPDLEKKFINLEKLDFLKGAIGFLLPPILNNIDENIIMFHIDEYLRIFDDNRIDSYKIINNDFFIRILLYNVFKDDKYYILNKIFDENSIRRLLINDKKFRIYAFHISNNFTYKYETMPKTYNDFIELHKNENNFDLWHSSSLYSIATLLYAEKNNKYVLKNHYIDTTKLPCIMNNNCYNGYYSKNKRLSSIIVEQNICTIINEVYSLINKYKDIIIYTENDKKVEPESFYLDCNGKNNLSAYKHLIYDTSGTIIIYFTIFKRIYTLWFIFDYGYGLTDETDQNDKKALQAKYDSKTISSNIDSLVCILNKLVTDENLTLAEIYNEDISTGFEKK